jgi:hypothetical protein
MGRIISGKENYDRLPSFIDSFYQGHFSHDRGVRISKKEQARELKEEITEKKEG